MAGLKLVRIDSRRITGVQRTLPGPGAIIDVTGPAPQVEEALRWWRIHLKKILTAIGRTDPRWTKAEIESRIVPGGASLGFTAPIDALYAACEVNEWAWNAACSELDGEDCEGFAAAVDRLSKVIAEEVNPLLIALEEEAARRGLPFISDDDEVSVGLGARSRTWPVGEIPPLTEIPWDELGTIPVVAVTGTNGKTTTIRLLASIARAAGQVAGFTSTDGVFVDGELLDAGDYSGPGGARMVVRDRRVEFALLESARGGLLRRGLPLAPGTATAIAVTNVAADHLGEFGVHDVDAIAETKLVLAQLPDASAPASIVLNADDPRLFAAGRARPGETVVWFSLRGRESYLQHHIDAGFLAATLEEDTLTLWIDGEAHAIARVDELPVTFGGIASHNVANALVAAALAHRAGIEFTAIAAGLRAFESTPENSPGRGNWFEKNGTKIYVDFAHNPHGFEAMVAMAGRLEYRRLGITLGQAGDRDDDSIRELARIACQLEPEKIVIKEMPIYLRGREPGEIPAMIEEELHALGVPQERISHAPSEGEAVAELRAWAEPGDLLLLPLHAERDEIIASLR